MCVLAGANSQQLFVPTFRDMQTGEHTRGSDAMRRWEINADVAHGEYCEGRSAFTVWRSAENSNVRRLHITCLQALLMLRQICADTSHR